MDNAYYPMIFKRKSFHLFRDIIPLTEGELSEIRAQMRQITPLCPDIKVALQLVPKEETSCKRGEYCILLYSEQKEHCLQNAGYIGEQLDLWLATKDIGVCWYGLAKPKEMQRNGLDFFIMLAIAKTDRKYFRKDYTKCARRALPDLCDETPDAIAAMGIAKYAPSACNSQPWFLTHHDDTFTLYRTRGKKGIFPFDKMAGINRIDIGIMMLFLEVYFAHSGIRVSRTLYPDSALAAQGQNEKALPQGEKQINASYKII